MLAALFSLAQLALDGWAQARQVVLHHVIVRARSHRFDRGSIGDLARDDDEREIQPLFFDQRQSFQTIEARHVVIGNHQVPLLPVQRRTHRLPGLSAVAERRVTSLL